MPTALAARRIRLALWMFCALTVIGALVYGMNRVGLLPEFKALLDPRPGDHQIAGTVLDRDAGLIYPKRVSGGGTIITIDLHDAPSIRLSDDPQNDHLDDGTRRLLPTAKAGLGYRGVVDRAEFERHDASFTQINSNGGFLIDSVDPGDYFICYTGPLSNDAYYIGICGMYCDLEPPDTITFSWTTIGGTGRTGFAGDLRCTVEDRLDPSAD